MVTTRSGSFVALCACVALLLGISTNAKADLLVDFGNSDDTLIESGWEGFEETQTTQTATQTFASDLGTGDTVEVSIAGNTFRKRGSETGTLANLLNDFCRSTSSAFGDTFVTLTLENLMAGEYEFTSYNYNSNTSYDRGSISVSVDDAIGSRTVLTSVNQDDLAEAVNTFSLTIDATGIATLTFQSYNATADSVAVLNGFTLAPTEVPEPSTLVLLTLGSLALCVGRYRSKRS